MDRFQWRTGPWANAENMVWGEKYRFTVLTERLIRCEYDAEGEFEDRASQMAFYRDFPKTEFSCSEADGVFILETSHLKVTYRTNEEFTGSSLSIALKTEPASVWHCGNAVENLGGTACTLDNINGEIPLGDGVCSRYGYAVLDDSDTMLLDDKGWVEVRKKETRDLYFFGYGYAYLDAVKDYYRLTGEPPMLPDYALGNWWSRYYKYTQQEYLDLMDRFREEDLPFSVGVVDMDWHIVDIPDELRDKSGDAGGWYDCENGWTGYTWNEELFPDYRRFLKDLRERNIKTSLNLHPHAGVCPHEAQYEEMAKALGVQPRPNQRIPFDVLSPKFMEAYFDILHHPYEEDGVDFWWMDWQQGKSYWWIHEENQDGYLQDAKEVLDPLWMLNHLHILDIRRNGKRPMFFSRFSGPGSHRYSVGFSGDTIVTWESLDFQPYFTMTASNIGYSWWSHDIGGHMCGYGDAELTTRWLQLGVLSPINRLHSSNMGYVRKEPWYFDTKEEKIMGDWLRLRHRLFPYLYTMNYRNHKELEPLVQPMYYHYPKCDAAYRCRNQFFFGSELMVAPITQKSSEITGLGQTKAFFPAGDWFDFFTGTHYYSDNNRTLDVFRGQASYPVFAKAGAIVPMKTLVPHDNTLSCSRAMEAVIFPGADNTFVLYEDGGDCDDFEQGAYVTTQMTLSYESKDSAAKARFVLDGAAGKVDLIPKERSWRLFFRGFTRRAHVSVWVNGERAEAEHSYDCETRSIVVGLHIQATDSVAVELSGDELIASNGTYCERCKNILKHANISIARKSGIDKILEKELSIHTLLRSIGEESPQDQALVNAIKEQLLLTEAEF